MFGYERLAYANCHHSQDTLFTFDVLGRYSCNTLEEAVNSIDPCDSRELRQASAPIRSCRTARIGCLLGSMLLTASSSVLQLYGEHIEGE